MSRHLNQTGELTPNVNKISVARLINPNLNIPRRFFS